MIVLFKSNHPVINSRYLMHEAQQAHYFGLPANLALASVTSTPAKVAGLSHRIGAIRKGSDADVVIWDSHPLQLGATPAKVWIDGILQIPVPYKTGTETNIEIGKGKEGDEWRKEPSVPNWDEERKKTIMWEGLPPLHSKFEENKIVFSNVTQLWTKDSNGSVNIGALDTGDGGTAVVVVNGKIACIGPRCLHAENASSTIDLRGGSISPGLISFGSPLGLEEIFAEPSTGDGKTFDAFVKNIPGILDDSGGVLRAMDGLRFGTRNALSVLAFSP